MVKSFFCRKGKDGGPLSEKEVSQLWKKLVDRTGDDDGIFEDASIFSMAALQIGLFPPPSNE